MTNGNHSAAPSHVSAGLTIREYFAAIAMQGICAGMNNEGIIGHRSCDSEGVADLAVIYADALIEALNKTTP